MPRFVFEKMGITENNDILVIHEPNHVIKSINLPQEPHTSTDLAKSFDHLILFVKDQNELDKEFPLYKQFLKANAKLWVVWPKSKKLGTDLNIKEVIRIGYNYGMVESTNLRIDDTWTALKFTHPKPNKKYNNSYGTLQH